MVSLFLVACAVTLIQLPSISSLGLPGMLLALGPLALPIVGRAFLVSQTDFLAASRLRLPKDKALQSAIVILCILLTVSFFRAYVNGLISIGEVGYQAGLLTTLVLFARVSFGSERGALYGVDAILAAVVIYLLANYALDRAGVASSANSDISAGTTARMLLALGIVAERKLFPLAVGLNSFGVIGGLAIAAGLAGLRGERSSSARAASALAVCVGLTAVLRTDTRIALASAVAAGGTALIWPSRWQRQLRMSVLLIPLLPVLFLAAALLLLPILSGSDLLRDPEELYTAGKRLFVWGAIYRELSDFSPIHLLGFGYFGQTSSLIVQRFGDVVGSGFDTGKLTAHNFVLQSILDIGYLGAATALAVFWLALSRLHAIPVSQQRPFAAILIFFLLSGTAESSPGAYTREAYVVFWLTVVYASSRRSASGESINRK